MPLLELLRLPGILMGELIAVVQSQALEMDLGLDLGLDLDLILGLATYVLCDLEQVT